MTLTTLALGLSWVAIIILAVAVYALTRQIGLLHERISPAGALSIGKQHLKTGEAAPQFELGSLNGGQVRIGGQRRDDKSTMLFFLSETCPVCKVLLPVLKSMQAMENSSLDIVLASDGDEAEHRRFIGAQDLQAFDYVLSEPLGRAFEVSKLPYAAMLDANGTLLSHGLVNNREHLESLLQARDLGVATVQEYVARGAA